MAFTYDSASLSATGTAAQKRNVVRHLIRDIDSTRAMFDDGEVDFEVTVHANIWMAAASLAEIWIGSARGVKSKWVGDTRFEYLQQRIPQWKARGLTHQKPFAGGVSISEKESLQDDSDWPVPDFERGMHDHVEADDSTSAVERRSQ